MNQIKENEIRQSFYENAKKFGISSESSNILPFLEFVLNQKIDALKEINQIYKNFDIRKSEGIFLDIEAFKLGLKRKTETKAVLKVKANCLGLGKIFSGTIFSDGKLDFATIEDNEFDFKKENVFKVNSLGKGSKYNLENGYLLYSNEYIKDLISLEVIEILNEGIDNESDDEFRSRLFKHIESFTLRDSKSYYESKLNSISEIKETKVIRTPRGINSMDVIIRKTNDNNPDEKIINKARDCIHNVLPIFLDINFQIARPINLVIKIRLKNLNSEIKTKITNSINFYFFKLKLGESFKIYDLYSICGDDSNILEPIVNLKPDHNEYFSPSLYFLNE